MGYRAGFAPSYRIDVVRNDLARQIGSFIVTLVGTVVLLAGGTYAVSCFIPREGPVAERGFGEDEVSREIPLRRSKLDNL